MLRIFCLVLVLSFSKSSFSSDEDLVVEVRATFYKSPRTNKYKYIKGSGFYVRRNLILTAYHVIEKRVKSDPITVIGSDFNEVEVELVYANKFEDVALLRIVGHGRNVVNFCEKINYGDDAYLITRVDGEVVKKSGRINHIQERFLISTIKTRPGYSGSPVFIKRGFSICIGGMHRLSGSRHAPSWRLKRAIKKYLNR